MVRGQSLLVFWSAIASVSKRLQQFFNTFLCLTYFSALVCFVYLNFKVDFRNQISLTKQEYELMPISCFSLTTSTQNSGSQSETEKSMFQVNFWGLRFFTHPTSSACRKFSRGRNTMLWVCKIIFRHRSIRRIKNHNHTTHQSKVTDPNVKMTRKKFYFG